jgi:hypothetical protein
VGGWEGGLRGGGGGWAGGVGGGVGWGVGWGWDGAEAGVFGWICCSRPSCLQLPLPQEGPPSLWCMPRRAAHPALMRRPRDAEPSRPPQPAQVPLNLHRATGQGAPARAWREGGRAGPSARSALQLLDPLARRQRSVCLIAPRPAPSPSPRDHASSRLPGVPRRHPPPTPHARNLSTRTPSPPPPGRERVVLPRGHPLQGQGHGRLQEGRLQRGRQGQGPRGAHHPHRHGCAGGAAAAGVGRTRVRPCAAGQARPPGECPC